MDLAEFIQSLTREGNPNVSASLAPFDEQTRQDANKMLLTLYLQDIPDMPGKAPVFNQDAALWAATFIYRTMQLVQLPNLSTSDIPALLTDYPGNKSPDVIYSADLCLRYLQDIYCLAAKSAIAAPLQEYLRQIAAKWPFSSTGMPVTDTTPISTIMEDKSLATAYADRIIVSRDAQRLKIPEVARAVKKALGNYQEILWPGFNPPAI
ncbi:hypothetical protein [Chitinophaga sp. Cy-1792]|uniref:hypothetical protein n=1 Tax=Chitinophaga sp. Cy-1792 TaxID=2608339 RepID=UPI00141F43AA|nr:hypothetical protein [Chitinophaga sp. Cy-1792]NIG53718.1 hypothetical protein [Chitinophaga sp. Cy-1792]